MKQRGWTLGFLGIVAQDRNKWKDLVEALCALEQKGLMIIIKNKHNAELQRTAPTPKVKGPFSIKNT